MRWRGKIVDAREMMDCQGVCGHGYGGHVHDLPRWPGPVAERGFADRQLRILGKSRVGKVKTQGRKPGSKTLGLFLLHRHFGLSGHLGCLGRRRLGTLSNELGMFTSGERLEVLCDRVACLLVMRVATASLATAAALQWLQGR